MQTTLLALATAVDTLQSNVADLLGRDFVLGGSNLTSVGKITKVSAAGMITQSSLTDNGTAVSGTEPVHLDTGAAPANSQLTLKANALGVLSLKCQAADNQVIGFDVDYVASGYVAANASVGLLLKNGAQVLLIGSVGNTIGNAPTLNNLLIVDLATGNLDVVAGGYKVGGAAGESVTLTYATSLGGIIPAGLTLNTKTVTFTKGIETGHT